MGAARVHTNLSGEGRDTTRMASTATLHIAVLGRKGGSAKTTTAYNVAGVLAAEGKRCLLVDRSRTIGPVMPAVLRFTVLMARPVPASMVLTEAVPGPPSL